MWFNQLSVKHLLFLVSGTEAKRQSAGSTHNDRQQIRCKSRNTDHIGRHTGKHDQLKLFLVGSRRTGTVTITSLLEEIGYGFKYHGWSLWWRRRRDIDFWLNVIDQNGVDIDWDELFVDHGPFHVTSDEPSILFWKSIVEYYPTMKVVLTVRSPEKWFKSYRNAILKTWPIPFKMAVVLQYFLPFAFKFFKVFRYGILQTFGTLGVEFGMEPFNKEKAIQKFVDRNEEIIRYFKEHDEMDRLFVIDWERKDKNEMFMEFMHFLEIELSPKELEQRLEQNDGHYFQHRNNTAKLRRDIVVYLCHAVTPLLVGGIVLILFCLCIVLAIIG